MEVALTEFVPVTDPTSVGEVRRTAMHLAQKLGFDETRSGELALLATEVSRNVLLHGGGGQVVLGGVKNAGSPHARILAIDSGPGIADVMRALSDGYSTAGTMGAGMGAMKRIASRFEIFTGPAGTIVLLELGHHQEPDTLQIAGIVAPHPGERVCGDGWIYHSEPERTVAMLVDGLGHGMGAADAAREAVTAFQRNVHLAPAEMLRTIHDALRKTRGAVAAAVEIRPKQGILTYAGVGNIAGVLMNGGKPRSLASYNGTLGVAISHVREFQFEWQDGAVLVLHSDGLHTRWDLSGYPGLMAKHAAVIGAALLRDFRRQRDDASVVVVKAA